MDAAADFTWIDGERLIRYGPGALADAPELLRQRGFAEFALLTTERAERDTPELAEAAAVVLHVPTGPVDQAAAAVRGDVGLRPLVAVGGGRVIDAAKGIAGADELDCACVPTTLSGAPMTKFHRMPAGVEGYAVVRPSLVLAQPVLMASQPPEDRAGSAMNALAHASEALYGPMASPVAELAALEAAKLLAQGLRSDDEEEARPALALGALLAGYAVGAAGFALHHVVGQSFVRVTGAPHAKAYAVLLPHTLGEMAKRRPEAVGKLALALGAPTPDPLIAPQLAAELAALSGAQRLSDIGVEREQLPEAAAAAAARPDLKTNTPDPPDEAELLALLERAY